MGIKDLNRIVRSFPEQNAKTFDTIIIDGTNLVITFLSKAASDLQLQPKNKYGTINKNVIYQMKFILSSTVNRAFVLINAIRKIYSVSRIYFVMDPKHNIIYKINKGMIDNKDYVNDLLEGADERDFELKADEREARKKASYKKDFVADMYYKIKMEDGELLANVFRESFHFAESCNVFCLVKIAIQMLYTQIANEFPENVFFPVNSTDEADLVIKNIGENETSEGRSVLICSNDTDYFVLFANNPNVYIGGLRINDKVYSPLTQWRMAFSLVNDEGDMEQYVPDEQLYNYAIRLAPLFGNDYNRDMIISAREYCNALKIFRPDLFDLPKYCRSGIDKFIKTESEHYKEGELVQLDVFDEMVRNYLIATKGEDGFHRYIFSVIVYSNYKNFCKYEICTKLENIEELLNFKISKFFVEDNMDSIGMINYSKYECLHEWKIDEEKNIVDIKELPKDIPTLLNMYNESDLKNNDVVVNYVDEEMLE